MTDPANQAAAMNVEAEYGEIVAAFEEAAVMAARVLADERKTIPELAAALREGFDRHARFPLAFDGQLEVARVLAFAALVKREDGGSEERLREYGVYPPDDEEDIS
jgi:hypothetical protein